MPGRYTKGERRGVGHESAGEGGDGRVRGGEGGGTLGM
jgi:hypothetical protein